MGMKTKKRKNSKDLKPFCSTTSSFKIIRKLQRCWFQRKNDHIFIMIKNKHNIHQATGGGERAFNLPSSVKRSGRVFENCFLAILFCFYAISFWASIISLF